MAKKAPYNNPALKFFEEDKAAPAADLEAGKEEPATDPAQPARDEKPPKGYKVNPYYIEVKSQRVQFVFQPSVAKRAKKAAKAKGISFNELAHVAIIEYLEKEGF